MRTVSVIKNISWIDISKPTDDDIKFLKSKYKIHPLTIKAIVSSNRYPDLDYFKNYMFMILHYPHPRESNDIDIREINIVAGADFIITAHNEDIPLLHQVSENYANLQAKKLENSEKNSGYLLFMVLNAFLKDNLAKLNDVVRQIDEIEKILFAGQERQLIERISALKMQIIDYCRIAEPQRSVFLALGKTSIKLFGEDYEHYSSIIELSHQRIEGTIQSAKNTVEALEKTNNILLNVKLNETIKVLTVFSVIFMPLTLLVSIWGMNTNYLPFQNTKMDFFIIAMILIATALSMVLYFRHKKWI